MEFRSGHIIDFEKSTDKNFCPHPFTPGQKALLRLGLSTFLAPDLSCLRASGRLYF